MTLITGQVSDVGMNNASGVFYARAAEFRGDGTTVVSPSPATFTITGGVVSAEVAPGPTIITLHVGPIRKDWFVNVPETDVGLGDLIATYTEYEPAVVSAAIKARDAAIEAESEAKQAAIDAEAKRVAAETAASLTGADRLHVDNVRALLDETYDQSQAGMALPPRLTETALNNTYGPDAAELQMFVSPRGSDANDGLNLKRAKATVGAAITAGAKRIIVGRGDIVETASWPAVRALKIVGAGKRLTRITASHAGDFATMAAETYLEGLTIDGASSPDGAAGLKFLGTEGKQELTDVAVINFDGYCLDFERQAGSQFKALNMDAYRRNAGTGTGRHAIRFPSGTMVTGAVPRSFINLHTSGNCAIDFGACDNVYVANSTMGDLRFTNESRAVSIVGGRILNQAELTVDGHNNSIVGVDIKPNVTIAPGADHITLGPGSFNGTITDNSGNGRNHVFIVRKTYTPALTSSGTAPTLGDGTLSAFFARSGTVNTVDLYFVVGSTTALGTGYLEFGLPTPTEASSARRAVSTNAILTRGGVVSVGIAEVHNASKFRVMTGAGSLIGGTAGTPLAAGDSIRLTLVYSQ